MTKKVQKKSNKKTQSKELTKEKLLASGLELFSKYGFDAATTKEISVHAGVNEALINRYFKGKAGLLEAIFVKHVIKVQLKVRNYPEGKTFEEDVRNYIECAYADFMQSPKLLKIILPLMLKDSALQKRVLSSLEIPNKKLFERLKYFQKKKSIHPSRDLFDIVDSVNLYISGLIHNKIMLKISLRSVDGNIKTISKMIAREFKNPG